jgi:hypothetical protein
MAVVFWVFDYTGDRHERFLRAPQEGSPQESDEVGILSGFLEGGEFGLGSG